MTDETFIDPATVPDDPSDGVIDATVPDVEDTTDDPQPMQAGAEAENDPAMEGDAHP